MRLGEEFVEVVCGENLAVEETTEVAGRSVGGPGQGWLSFGVGFKFEGGDAAVGDAAGNNPAEVAKIGGDIKGEAVGGDAAGNVDAECGDLLFLHRATRVGPDAGAFADALGGDAKVLAGEDEGFFKKADEVDGT